MGLHQHSTISDVSHRFDIEGGAPAECKPAQADYPIDDGDPLGAARGIALGVVLGGLIWGGILWLVL